MARPIALIGKRVAVELRSVAEFYVACHNADRKLFRTQEETFRAAADGEAAGALLWLPVAAWHGRVQRHSER